MVKYVDVITSSQHCVWTLCQQLGKLHTTHNVANLSRYYIEIRHFGGVFRRFFAKLFLVV